ncbi:TetR/AcrR family transcriptional regulator [Streptomonospora wellingtoniae]|uniref:TetR/AcrR family transcriptional regulator n=1 Tax=Streptomonospora wellingtoniae TaxID=3075544 RepID=A0ABU2KYS0_9ACTN|nr:TetR/AcrR family transcriptional regulator [Streptomonospora sp. DSM 45055]MDT0304450.1 TetR/AcrR family transcriptional regulator [Streptomonospora sp. DSM 45055]
MQNTDGSERSATAPGRGPAVPDRLLSVATRLFAEQGFERTSVQELVSAAGVTKGAMYHYFTSKEDLLYAIYQRVLAMQTERLNAFAGAEGPVGERLRNAAVDVVHTTVDNLDDTRIFFRSLHMLSDDRMTAVRKERRRYHERFRGMIEEGQREGVFRTDVPADIAVTQYFGAVHHLSTWYRAGGELTGSEVGTYFAELLLAELRPADPAPGG